MEEIYLLNHAVNNADMRIHIPVQAGAEPVNEGDCAYVQRRLLHICRTGAVGLQSLRDDPEEDARNHAQNCPVTLHEVAHGGAACRMAVQLVPCFCLLNRNPWDLWTWTSTSYLHHPPWHSCFAWVGGCFCCLCRGGGSNLPHLIVG